MSPHPQMELCGQPFIASTYVGAIKCIIRLSHGVCATQLVGQRSREDLMVAQLGILLNWGAWTSFPYLLIKHLTNPQTFLDGSTSAVPPLRHIQTYHSSLDMPRDASCLTSGERCMGSGVLVTRERERVGSAVVSGGQICAENTGGLTSFESV